MYKKEIGFTLIELIAVIVIVGIIAAFSTGFVVNTVRGFATVNSQSALLRNSQLSIDYVVRRLRNALPYSVRIVNGGDCLQFMSISSSGLYLNVLPSVINGGIATGSITPITVSPFIVNSDDADYLAIAPASSDEVYGVLPSALAEIDTFSTNQITLTDDKQWIRNSINQRFYIVDSPSAFCLVANELRFYRNLSIADSVINTSQNYALVIESVAELGEAFSISSAIEDRNIKLTLSLLFTRNEHRMESVQQVVVRNVP